MGLSWKSAVNAIVDPDHLLEEGDRSDPALTGILWAIALGACLVLLPLIVFCLGRRAYMQRKAQEAAQSGDSIEALRYRGQEMSYNALVNWGLTFALAAQIDNAVRASIPTSSVIWLAAYVACLMLSVCITAAFAKMCYTSDTDGSFAAGLANTLISGATYVVVLAFLGMIESLFELSEITISEDAVFLVLFSAISVLVAAIINTMLAYVDSGHAEALYRSAAEGTSLLQPFTGKTRCCCMGLCQRLGLSLRKFLSKVVSMCAVVVLYTCLHVALAKDVAGFAAVHKPLSPDRAGILLGLCTAFALVGGLLLDLVSRRVIDRMELQSKASQDAGSSIQGSRGAQVAIVSAVTLAQTGVATATEALSWLVGCACDGFAASLWRKFVCDEACLAEDLKKVAAPCAYAAVCTLLALVASACLPAPPKAG
eukprot:TRINITY_DN28605_c0_g1_i1.p1 TRINITY_DN28605_c0_g1~~TRINITY_DN28605_c0_g1_i1.p1  ORF type:complete len:490 (+),score=54.46 TRINITY_DN28605_c0_g1_i1:193-1470(+)